ncbi:MAG TPA: DUF3137 domain-containing protein [Bacteroidales bacterium]|nr:DUF3137 domain-containing protein [Bacteroidales bacterium]
MKSIKEVESYFETDIKPLLAEIEEWRIKTRKKFILNNAGCALPVIILALICLVNFAIYLFGENIDSDLIIAQILGFIFGFMLPVIIYFLIRFFIRDKSDYPQWNIRFKKQTVSKLVNFLDAGMTYDPYENLVSGEEFLGGEIFEHSIYYPKGYIGEDLFTWKIGETNIRFYEINGRDVAFTRPNTYDGTVEKIPFFGFFLVADFGKSFNGHILVLPETKIKRSNWIRESGRELIKMDDPEFESFFTVYGTNPVTTHYILSTSLMRRITDFRKKINKKIHLSFTSNKLFIAIPHTVDQFDVDFNRSVFDFDRIKDFYNDISIAYEIVEDLNLNTRIWAKGTDITSILPELPANYHYRRKWLFRLLTFFFGYTGIQFIYAGYYGKALKYFLINAGIISFLIHGLFFGKESLSYLYYLLTAIYGFTGFLMVNIYSSWITHDSKGIPMK